MIPNKIVINNIILVERYFLLSKQLCLQVNVIPDVIKIKEFNKGISYGLKGKIFLGGQFIPISIDGDKKLWK